MSPISVTLSCWFCLLLLPGNCHYNVGNKPQARVPTYRDSLGLPRLVRDDPDFTKKRYGLKGISVVDWDKEVDSQCEEISDLPPESSQPEDVTFNVWRAFGHAHKRCGAIDLEDPGRLMDLDIESWFFDKWTAHGNQEDVREWMDKNATKHEEWKRVASAGVKPKSRHDGKSAKRNKDQRQHHKAKGSDISRIRRKLFAD
ncbi:hypothetical protein GUITHDRAFT_103780 [Guillardia theta CCMP2712]|uniref:Uncharacterized protein n=1 Tax=Guillardia theta (strain CCMP2712) TaxID=905079 RepID=L1JR37_GUITC|nr:hypothetical protein GUITHDRAFT_103780 [Guillardia theta CCMP2712]EKX50553.1 hypothetical protein GUITHDRAFT_103780 [Guillardia theta CCMP2712]|eukprot:XP_005837533.1 hypothetical protein GUITHDRAFT_103780 [Guillardia theta CCMP2712]